MGVQKCKGGCGKERYIAPKWEKDYPTYTCRSCKTKLVEIPTRKEFHKAIEKYEYEVGRDSAYEVAGDLIHQSLKEKNHTKMADGINIFVSIWNQAFYRFGWLDLEKLEGCVKDNFSKICILRKRSISTLSSADEDDIKNLFDEFNEALKIITGKKKGTKSPVSASKALHILAPKFFPLWDSAIARKYKCGYSKNPAKAYLNFCCKTKEMEKKFREFNPKSGKTLLKMIDEYNYAKWTKGWI